MFISAHFEDDSSNPAAFWELKNLKEGDKVFVLDASGETFTYVVKESLYVDAYASESLDVLEDEEGKYELTLATCSGIWLPAYGTYSDRLVVKAELL